MIQQGLIRPILVMVIAWFMATKQMIRRHAEVPQPGVLLLQPAYMFFYTIFVSAGFLLAFHEHDRRLPADPATKCEDYHNEVFDKFGFITQDTARGSFRSANFLMRILIIYAINTVVAIGYGFYVKRMSKEELTTHGFKKHIFLFSTITLGSSLLIYGLMFLATLIYARQSGHENAPDAAAAGCYVAYT
nr:hypothetical protein TetV2_00099 [Oceanusvirus sp.]